MPQPPRRVQGPDGKVHEFPGDFSDAEIASALDSVLPREAAPQPSERSWLDTAKDVGTGLVQSGAGAFAGLGSLVHQIPGVSTAVDTLYGTPGVSEQSFREARAVTTPQNAAQSVGKLAGDIAQVIVPGNTITRTATSLASQAPRGLQLATRAGVEGVAGAGIGAAQGGDPTTAGVISGAVPIVGKAAGKVSSALKAQVPEHVMKALGPTKEKYKAMAERITPGIIARKLGGSREALQQQAHESAQEAGRAIDDALKTEHGGKVLGVQPVQDALEQAKQRYINVVAQSADDLAEQATDLPATDDVGALFSAVLTDAKKRGFKGSPGELRKLFDQAVTDAKALGAEMTEVGDGLGTPKGLLKAIARHGGIGKDTNRLGRARAGHAGVGNQGEVDQLWEHSTGMVVGRGHRKGTSAIRSSRKLPSGAIGGVSGVVRHDGKNLEEMVEALNQDGWQIADVNGLLNEIDTARVAMMRPPDTKPLSYWLEGVGVKPGTNWWGGGDAAPSLGKSVILDKRAVRQIESLQETLKEHGDTMTVDQLVAVRRVWDDVVAQAGGFAHRAPGGIGIPLKDATEAWAKRKATTAIRQLLDAEVPELTALNKEFAFWKSLDDVLTQTMRRTAPQGPGLKSIAAEGAGRLAGAITSGGGAVSTVGNIWVLGKLVKLVDQAFASPRWQFATARMKDDLADAIVNGKLDKAASVLARVTAVQGSKAVPVGAQ